MKRLGLGLFLACFAGVLPSLGAYRAIDGDTIVLPSGEHMRIVGFDTPETFQSQCAAEKKQGLRAKERTQELLDGGPVTVVPLAKRDKYGRLLGQVLIGKEDLGVILIREGLAVPYTGKVRRVVNYNWCEHLRY